MRNILIVTIIILMMPSLNAVSGKKIIQEIKEKFSEMETFETDFIQEQYWELADEKSEINGKMFMKGNDTFRVEMPGGDFVLSNGKTVWRYSVENAQILIENIKEGEDTMLPGKILFNFTDKYVLSDHFEKKKNGDIIYVLHLKSPPDDLKFIDEMKVSVRKDFVPFKIEYSDLDDNTTVYELKNIKINEKIDSCKFEFIEIEDTDIIDLRKKK